MRDGILGMVGLVLSVSIESVQTWVSIVCAAAIAVTTCGVQIYRMIRDRDTDKMKTNKDRKDKGGKNDG